MLCNLVQPPVSRARAALSAPPNLQTDQPHGRPEDGRVVASGPKIAADQSHKEALCPRESRLLTTSSDVWQPGPTPNASALTLPIWHIRCSGILNSRHLLEYTNYVTAIPRTAPESRPSWQQRIRSCQRAQLHMDGWSEGGALAGNVAGRPRSQTINALCFALIKKSGATTPSVGNAAHLQVSAAARTEDVNG
ncbi:hypothetical protein HUJ04_000229 [Dendroctonus ponderosae]|nr:hypothetical protein HUJ04_000229 [Dendroctonus ponderosae]